MVAAGLRRHARDPLARRKILRWAAFWAVIALAALAAPAFVSSPTTAVAPALLAGTVVLARRAPLLVLVALGVCSGMFVTIVVVVGLPVYPIMHGLILGLGIAAVIELLRSRKRPQVVLGVWSFTAFSLVSLLWVIGAESLELAVATWRQVYLFLLVTPIVAIAPMGGLRSDRIVRAWMLLGIGLAGYALLRWQIGPAPEEAAFAERTAGNFTKFEDELRPLGGAGDAHGMASVMVPIVPFAFTMMLGLPGVWRLAAAVCFAATAVCVVISDTRSAMVACALGVGVVLIALLMARATGGRRVLAVYGGTLLIIGAIGVTVTSYSGSLDEQSKRFSAILTPEDDPSFQNRLRVWTDVFDAIDERPLGFGMTTATTEYAAFVRFETVGTENVASSYLRLAYEQGFVYCVLFIGALVLMLLSMLREAALARSKLAALCSCAGAGSLVAYAVLLNFESPYIGIGSAVGAWALVGLGVRQIAWRGQEPGSESVPAAFATAPSGRLASAGDPAISQPAS